MGPGNTRLVERARSIFSELGYTVEGTGTEFRAEREWKVVTVNAVGDGSEVPSDGTYHCFVTRPERVEALEGRLRSIDPEYEWAILAVDGDEYEVERAPPGPTISV